MFKLPWKKQSGDADSKSEESNNPAETTPVSENPLDSTRSTAEGSGGAELVDNIVATETGSNEETLLEDVPDIDVGLLDEIEPQKSILLLILKAVFWTLLAIGLGSWLFFTSQFTNKLDLVTEPLKLPNISNELTASNAEILSLQTDLNFYRLLQVKSSLDRFTYLGDSYIQAFENSKSQTLDNPGIEESKKTLVTLRNNLKKSFVETRDIYLKSFDPVLFSKDGYDEKANKKLFADKLKNIIDAKIANLKETDDASVKLLIKNYQHMATLIDNQSLSSILIDTDFDSLSDKELYDLCKVIGDTFVNNLSLIQRIKHLRIHWSDVMNEIKLRTIDIDKYYSDGIYEQLGGIRYNSYDIDTDAKQITITGETKRFDTENFTMIADLIDRLNGSKFFENAEMRSFSKSGSLETGYTSNVKLTLDLQEVDFTETDQPKDLKNFPVLKN